MAIQIRKAERVKSKLRLGIAGPSGAGKTMGALKLAKGLGGKICLIDTERGSGDLYAHLYDYDIISLTPPYAPKNYVDAVKAAEEAGYDVIIIDSLSHAWTDEGGLLDQVEKKGGSSFNAWKDITPQHRTLVNAMLNSTAHIIATMRSKQAYEMEEYIDAKGSKRSRPVKLGLAPVQREGMEYEFTVMMDVNHEHFAQSTKDRTNMFVNEVFQLNEEIGQRLLNWLNDGKDAPIDVEAEKRKIVHNFKRLGLVVPQDKPQASEMIKILTGIEYEDKNLPNIVKALELLKNAEDAQATWGIYVAEKKKKQESENKDIAPVSDDVVVEPIMP